MRASASLLTGVLLLAASYETEILAWRTERENRLKSDAGWLTVAGLFWLQEGRNTFGAAPDNQIVLPDGPAHAGWFELHAGKVTAHAAGEPPRLLQPDREDAAHTVRVKHLTLFPIVRGGRFGIRLRDPNSEFRRRFTGLHWYPVKPPARITAAFVAEPASLPIPNILGQTENEASPGYAKFQWEGRELRLRPTMEDGRLFFVFRDLTSGRETYPAGRFL